MSARLAGIDCTACPHVMHAMSGTLKTCAYVLGTCVPSCTGMIVRLFFMLEAHGPQGTMGHVSAPEPTSVQRRSPEP
jgi:hypothetical protein